MTTYSDHEQRRLDQEFVAALGAPGWRAHVPGSLSDCLAKSHDLTERLLKERDGLAARNAKMLECLKEIRVHYSPLGRPGQLIDAAIRGDEQ